MKRDQNYLAALEKSMREQYGNISIENPASWWTPDKEPEYLDNSKELVKKESISDASKEKVDLDGVLIPKKLINRNNNRHCQYCDSYSFDRKDDIYFTKWTCCQRCFVKYIQDREERWKNGWRPNGV